MDYIFYFDYAALAIALIIIVEYNVRNTVKSRQTLAFLSILYMAALATSLDLGSCYALRHVDVLPLWFNHLLILGFDMTFHALPPFYLYYMIVSSKRDEERLTVSEIIQVFGLYIVDFLMLLTNGLTHFVYKIDENFKYVNGFGTTMSYAIAFIYLGITAVYIIRKKKDFNRRQKMNIIIYSLLLILGIVIQLINPGLLVIDFCVMLSVLILAFTMESPSYYEEQELGVYNRLGFQAVCSNFIAGGKQFAVIGLGMDNLVEFRDIVGINNVSQMLKEAAGYLVTLVGRKNVFSVSEFKFAIVVEGGEAEVEMNIKKIKRRFEMPFKANEGGIRLSYSMSRFSFPRDVQSTESVLNLLDYSLFKANQEGKDTVVVATSALLEEKSRANQVLQILKRAIAENRFSVYYQPIFSVENQNFSSAEALVRLYDDDLGFISPDEFIPIAEKNGLIVKIGDYVFNEVCRFMTENKLFNKGIEYIAINLSPVQCFQEDLYEQLIGILDKHQLEYNRICLEIKEMEKSLSGKTLRDNMTRLVDAGLRFSLDDYGAGYANLTTIVEYPFTIVKLDKNMLWSAMKSDKAMTVLRQTIRMMKQLSLELVAEGVETEEQSQLLAYYGCDFFQGYFYAKPQNGESFLRLLEKTDKKEEE